MELRGTRVAPGAPGIPPRWSHSNKEGIGTAYSADCRLWYTIWRGIVTEVYFPRIDRPQLRDVQYLFTDGETFFHEEKRHLTSSTTRPSDHALSYVVTSEDPDGRYRLQKTILGDPHLPVLLLHTKVSIAEPRLTTRLRMFALASPHLDVGGWGNTASVYEVLGHQVLAAEKNGYAVAMLASRPYGAATVGYVGASDGFTELAHHRRLTQEFDQAPDGNVALLGEIPLGPSGEFTLGLAFGDSIESAVTSLLQSLGTPFEMHHRRFLEQWKRTSAHEVALARASRDKGRLYRSSRAILLAHEDKTFPGAFIASLSIPWGAAHGDDDRGGYHLVWTRDMVHTAEALLASGSTDGPLRSLIYLATRQRPDGGFPQNFWVDGSPYWQGQQLDEVALPILLANQLLTRDGLAEFDPLPMVRRAARFLIDRGPVTQQDRWEEVGGFSPSTLASNIAALSAGARLARTSGDGRTAQFVQEYADFLEAHVEPWTVTHEGTLLPEVPRHYVRIRPADVTDVTPNEGPDLGTVRLPNLAPGTPNEFPASEIVDAGFLDLVRYGVRAANDPLIENSVRVVDHVLRTETPAGPVWRRYNHDGYGQRDDGGPYVDWGTGRAWPLLTGERGHYELARGRDPTPYLRTMERLATQTGLLSEQVWDGLDRPALHLALGKPTEAAMPLVWAHAEYVKLLRSATDRSIFDRCPEVAERYAESSAPRTPREVWKFNRQPATVAPGAVLRVIGGAEFRLRASDDGWRTVRNLDSTPTGIGLHFVDLDPLGAGSPGWAFTFYWTRSDRWEGRNFAVAVGAPLTPP